MELKDAIKYVQTGVEQLELAAVIAAWQVKRGGYVVFEHPAGAHSWSEPYIQRLANIPGIHWVQCHMYAFGMQVNSEGYNLKPAGLLTNSKKIADRMNRRCPGGH